MRKRTKRKHSLPLCNPITLAMVNAAITSTEDLDKLRTAELMSIEAFAKGVATTEDWKRLADLLNLAETMALYMHIGPEVIPTAQAASKALGEALRRKREHGRLGLSGPELETFRHLLEYHDLQRSSVPRKVYAEAIRRTSERVRSTPAAQRVEIA